MQLPPRGYKDPSPEDFSLNTISKRAVAYSCGRLAMPGDKLVHRHHAEDLALCRRLAGEAARIMKGTEVGMGSESSDYFAPFFVAANIGDPVPKRITERLIRERFGGTIYPPATIWIEPLKEKGKWWAAVLSDGGEDDEDEKEQGLKPWRDMIRWFRSREELHGAAFVRIGDDPLDRECHNAGCVFPRLALALTGGGGLVGICGHVVHT